MPTLKERVGAALASWIPQKRITRFDVRAMPSEIASTLDVDRMADIIRGAQNGNITDLMALYRDIILTHSHLQGRFSERKEAVVGDSLNIQPFDKKSPTDVVAAKVIDTQIGTLASWETACLHLLDSALYPVAVVEKLFRRADVATIRATLAASKGAASVTYEIADLIPVPHELLDFTSGRLQIRDTDANGHPTGTSRDIDPSRYIVHRAHTLSFPDNWGGPMRSLVFWWLLGTMDREWWARFLDKYGMPFLVGKYDQADDASRSIMERAFSLATKLGGLVVSRETDIEIKQAAASDSAAAFETFHRVANEEMSKLILGQTLSSDAKGTGMGSGVADAQSEMRQDKRQSDSRRLGATFRFQLFEQILRYNGLDGRAPMAIWGSVSTSEITATAQWLMSLSQAGLRVGDDGLETLSERFGMPIERAPAAPAPGGGLFPMSVQLHSAGLPGGKGAAANQAIMRSGGARLAQALGTTYAPLEALIATAATPAEALDRIETYCATLDAVTAAEIIEQSLTAFAANGSGASAR
jgi:phage gp29-like protein